MNEVTIKIIKQRRKTPMILHYIVLVLIEI